MFYHEVANLLLYENFYECVFRNACSCGVVLGSMFIIVGLNMERYLQITRPLRLHGYSSSVCRQHVPYTDMDFSSWPVHNTVSYVHKCHTGGRVLQVCCCDGTRIHTDILYPHVFGFKRSSFHVLSYFRHFCDKNN